VDPKLAQPLALTLGEPAGIGPDLALAIWQRRSELGLPPFYVVGDPAFLRRRAEKLKLDVPIAAVSLSSAMIRRIDARISSIDGSC